MAEDCLFCKIRDGEIPSEILHRDEHCFVIRDIAPTTPTHLLVIPVQHFTYLIEMTPEFNILLEPCLRWPKAWSRLKESQRAGIVW